MQLSRTERWMLANQYKILEALYPDEAAYYEKSRTALERGYEMEYPWLCEHIYEETLSVEECREVLDILEMFSNLKYSYEKLQDKSGIDEYRISFSGFDGNNEGAYLDYADHYCNREDDIRYPELGFPKDLNSHAPLLGGYRRMLEEWRTSKDKLHLSKTEIIRITEALTHPDNRKP